MTININKEWKRDVVTLAIACFAVVSAIMLARLIPANVTNTEWIDTDERLPNLEESVVGMYLVKFPDGIYRRWELNVVRIMAAHNGTIKEFWLIDRPEASPELGRPARWKPLDISDYPDKTISYQEIQLFAFSDQGSLWTY